MDLAQDDDLYELLGVEAEAAIEEISKAYKKLARELHPDRFPDDEEARATASERFSRVTNAYNVLKDEEQRAEYDFARRMGYGGKIAGDSGAAPAAAGAAAGPPGMAEMEAIHTMKVSQAQNQFDQGKVYHRSKNWPKAISCYKEAVRLNNTVADYHAHLGLAYLMQGLKTPGQKSLEAAYKLDRNNKIVKEHFAGAQGKGGKGGKAGGGGGLLAQILALFGGGKKDAKGKGKKKKK